MARASHISLGYRRGGQYVCSCGAVVWRTDSGGPIASDAGVTAIKDQWEAHKKEFHT